LIATILTSGVLFSITSRFLAFCFMSPLIIPLSDLLRLSVREIRRHVALISNTSPEVQIHMLSQGNGREGQRLYVNSTIRGASGSETSSTRRIRRDAVRPLPTRAMRCAIIAHCRTDDVVDLGAASRHKRLGELCFDTSVHIPFPFDSRDRSGGSWGFKHWHFGNHSQGMWYCIHGSTGGVRCPAILVGNPRSFLVIEHNFAYIYGHSIRCLSMAVLSILKLKRTISA
jgi:hypothetical protein